MKAALQLHKRLATAPVTIPSDNTGSRGVANTQTVMSLWQYFRHWLHRKLWKWQLPMPPVMEFRQITTIPFISKRRIYKTHPLGSKCAPTCDDIGDLGTRPHVAPIQHGLPLHPTAVHTSWRHRQKTHQFSLTLQTNRAQFTRLRGGKIQHKQWLKESSVFIFRGTHFVTMEWGR